AKISPKGQQAVVRESQIISSGLICQLHVAEHLAGQRLVYLGEKRSTGYLQAASEVVSILDMDEKDTAAGFVLLGCGGYDWRTGLDLSVNFIRRRPELALLAPNPD